MLGFMVFLEGSKMNGNSLNGTIELKADLYSNMYKDDLTTNMIDDTHLQHTCCSGLNPYHRNPKYDITSIMMILPIILVHHKNI